MLIYSLEYPDLTVRQAEMLDLIIRHISRMGYCPSIREIGKSMNISSPNGVMCHLTALRKCGYISKINNNRKRAIELTAKIPTNDVVIMNKVEICVKNPRWRMTVDDAILLVKKLSKAVEVVSASPTYKVGKSQVLVEKEEKDQQVLHIVLKNSEPQVVLQEDLRPTAGSPGAEPEPC